MMALSVALSSPSLISSLFVCAPLPDGDNDVLTPREAISFLKVQQSFTIESCNGFISIAQGVMVALGLAFRALAFLALKLKCL